MDSLVNGPIPSELLIRYKDSSGEVTERTISDIRQVRWDTVDAFCHLRMERRHFKILNVLQAVNPETGEFVENLWKAFGMSGEEKGRERLESVTVPVFAAIKALKVFPYQTRGFGKRERAHVVRFIREQVGCDRYMDDEIDEWVHSLWVGDVQAYCHGDASECLEVVAAVPHSQRSACRETAIAIARGSGRKPLDPDLLSRINHEWMS
jgi:hypothetical protein